MRIDLVKGYKRPPAFCDVICRAYGVNRSGEPLWRVRCERDRIALFGGYWEGTGQFEYKRTRRYSNDSEWILERYVPAREFGSPESWSSRSSNVEGYLNQGPYPVEGVYICTHRFTQPLTPTLVYRTVQSVAYSHLLDDWTRLDMKRQEIAADEQQKDDTYDREWEMIDSPRRGMTFAGAKRLNQDENRIIEKATEIAAQTGGKFKQAKQGFEQIESLEALN